MTVDVWDRIARVGETPTPQQPKRLARRDLRVGERLPAHIVEVTAEQLLVPRGTRLSAVPEYLRSVPGTFEGRIPMRSGDSPYWLALCAAAPRRLFERGFAPIWLATHLAVQEQVDIAEDYTPKPGPETVPNMRIERAASLDAIAPWLDAAHDALAASRKGLRGRL